MGLRICLDTNIFIAVKNREARAPACARVLDEVENSNHAGIVPSVVLSEVLTGFYSNGEDMEASTFSKKIVQNFEVAPLDLEISDAAAKIRALTGIRLPDAIVIATAKKKNCALLLSMDAALLKVARGQTQKAETPEEFLSEDLSSA
ncbi:MAG: type II toxin-antitoxin system VapC family toxin [Promethearchaeota archaeon]